MRNFITNIVDATRNSEVRLNVFANDTYSLRSLDCTRLLPGASFASTVRAELRDKPCAAILQPRWQTVPAPQWLAKRDLAEGQPAHRVAMQPVGGMPARSSHSICG